MKYSHFRLHALLLILTIGIVFISIVRTLLISTIPIVDISNTWTEAPPGGMIFAPDKFTSEVHGAAVYMIVGQLPICRAENTNRAAALIAHCSLSIRWRGRPARSQIPAAVIQSCQNHWHYQWLQDRPWNGPLGLTVKCLTILIFFAILCFFRRRA